MESAGYLIPIVLGVVAWVAFRRSVLGGRLFVLAVAAGLPIVATAEQYAPYVNVTWAYQRGAIGTGGAGSVDYTTAYDVNAGPGFTTTSGGSYGAGGCALVDFGGYFLGSFRVARWVDGGTYEAGSEHTISVKVSQGADGFTHCEVFRDGASLGELFARVARTGDNTFKYAVANPRNPEGQSPDVSPIVGAGQFAGGGVGGVELVGWYSKAGVGSATQPTTQPTTQTSQATTTQPSEPRNKAYAQQLQEIFLGKENRDYPGDGSKRSGGLINKATTRAADAGQMKGAKPDSLGGLNDSEAATAVGLSASEVANKFKAIAASFGADDHISGGSQFVNYFGRAFGGVETYSGIVYQVATAWKAMQATYPWIFWSVRTFTTVSISVVAMRRMIQILMTALGMDGDAAEKITDPLPLEAP